MIGPSLYRILFVLTQPLDPHSGGVQMSTCKLGRHFSELGHQIGVFSFAQHGHQKIDFGHLWSAPRDGGHGVARNLDALDDVLGVFRPDIVINQMPYERPIGALLKARKRFLLLGCLRNTLFSVKGNLATYVRRTAPGFLKRFSHHTLLQRLFLAMHCHRHRKDLSWILDTYDFFVMFGPPNLEELEYFLPGYDRDRIRLVPNSIPAVLEDVPPKERRILWLGRVAKEQKQAGMILDIWRQISNDLPGWTLDVVGDGPERAGLVEQAKSEGLQRIEFHGRQIPDEFYRRAAVFFMTSAFEGFPNTLVEAMSYGCIPVVFDSYPVASWLVRDGVNGVLVSPFDVSAMSDAIRGVAQSADRATRAGRSLESVRQFQIDRVGQQWQGLFDQESPSRQVVEDAVESDQALS